MQHRHTGETLNSVYYTDGVYIPDALKEVSFLLRDHRTDEVKEIDPALLDLLYALRQRMETGTPFQVYSGYRSPTTNARLRRDGVGAAKNSLHMHGKAVDVGLEGVNAAEVFRAASSLQRGGVGFYGRSSFVHLDVGGVRTWGRR